MTVPASDAPGALRRFHEKFIVEVRPMPAPSRRNLYIVAGVLAAIGLVAFFVILDSVRESDGLSVIDKPVQAWLEGLLSPTLTVVMAIIATVFGPIALPIIVLVTTVWWGFAAQHAWRPALLAVSMIVGVATVQILAPVIDRQRPAISTMLLGVDHTPSFPSGHVMGATDFLLITTFLVFSRRRNPVGTVIAFIVAVILALATAACRIYLGYHWPTDVLASISLSLVLLGVVIAVDTGRTVRVEPPAAPE
ncbi:phosphatase PAP2 family protein [Glaciibacter psychrotolerans]|uniref:Undecaprenyl-diphosphatase n=1 Tax=Glaciibacter psychrotolerans TaxID=670054 RepID=A0A7Z0EEL2_9MICO|nr:phosphatase PAP2 family protein [Leifsonia psychrotolerans]NYJ19517.1 undecaprenyl-diphosphatase [Leifsonia psychrotolerans]